MRTTQLFLGAGVSQKALNESLAALAGSNQRSARYYNILLRIGTDSGHADVSTSRFKAPHHSETRNGVTSAMQLLLEQGALPNFKDDANCTPHFHSTRNEEDATTKILFKESRML
jgi:ankyrin repeat protein